jgi:hypothetical protein
MPSADEEMLIHALELSRGVHVSPPSVEVYSWPPLTAAANLMPSEEEAMEIQLALIARAFHVTPLSVDM